MKETSDSNTETKILEAAEKLFKERGYALTSTVEIAREAGCNQALVHYYFRSKEKLFTKVFEKIAHLILSSFFEIDEKDLSFEERLRLKIESHFNVLAANPRLPFFFFNEISTHPERLNSIRERIGQLPQSILSKLQNDLDTEYTRGNIRKMNALDLIMTVISLNVMLFLSKPLFQMITNITDQEFSDFIIQRKEEHVRIILASLKNNLES
jgi:TetR/AcrR family transcriptional regulator